MIEPTRRGFLQALGASIAILPVLGPHSLVTERPAVIAGHRIASNIVVFIERDGSIANVPFTTVFTARDNGNRVELFTPPGPDEIVTIVQS